MADKILTLKQLEDLFRGLTCTLLGLDPSAPANSDKVRIAWSPVGAPAWKRTEDVVFIRVRSTDDVYSKQRDTEYTPNTSSSVYAATSYTLPRMVSWTAYGPNSFDNIETIRNGLFEADETLAASNLHLVIDVPVPVRVPELFNGQWWDRSDFSATFYEKITRQKTVPTIASASVTFRDAKGIIKPSI